MVYERQLHVDGCLNGVYNVLHNRCKSKHCIETRDQHCTCLFLYLIFKNRQTGTVVTRLPLTAGIPVLIHCVGMWNAHVFINSNRRGLHRVLRFSPIRREPINE